MEGALCPNYLSRFSVFNENSCGNSVSIKQVKEKQENNTLEGLLYLERRGFTDCTIESLKLKRKVTRAGGSRPGARTNGIASSEPIAGLV